MGEYNRNNQAVFCLVSNSYKYKILSGRDLINVKHCQNILEKYQTLSDSVLSSVQYIKIFLSSVKHCQTPVFCPVLDTFRQCYVKCQTMCFLQVKTLSDCFLSNIKHQKDHILSSVKQKHITRFRSIRVKHKLYNAFPFQLTTKTGFFPISAMNTLCESEVLAQTFVIFL